jgi:hypothetical protein
MPFDNNVPLITVIIQYKTSPDTWNLGNDVGHNGTTLRLSISLHPVDAQLVEAAIGILSIGTINQRRCF